MLSFTFFLIEFGLVHLEFRDRCPDSGRTRSAEIAQNRALDPLNPQAQSTQTLAMSEKIYDIVVFGK